MWPKSKGVTDLMRDVQRGYGVFMEIGEEAVEDLFFRFSIETCEGFIQQQEARAGCESPGNGNALPLSA